MCNCYAACGDDFENTVRMVAGARRLTPDTVKDMLERMAGTYSEEKEYKELRKKLPYDFPF